VFRQAVAANSSRDIDRIDESCVAALSVVEPAKKPSERQSGADVTTVGLDGFQQDTDG